MTTNRFDPKPDVNFGRCLDCDFVAVTESVANAHMQETREVNPARRSHGMRITNPNRDWRVFRFVSDVCSDAINEAFEKIDEAILDGDLTNEEAKQALTMVDEFYGAWETREVEEES